MARAASAVSIEDQFKAIDDAVAALDGGDLPLEEALQRYEAGLKAVRAAKQQLDRYQARLVELRADGQLGGTGAPANDDAPAAP